MKHRKQKKPSKNMLPSSETQWKWAMVRFHLSPEELAMAQAIEFTPVLMDEMAMGRCIRRSPYDPLPRHATPGQIKKIKQTIRERFKSKRGQLVPLKPILIPAELKVCIDIQCGKEGVTPEEEIRKFLETRFAAVALAA
jgi:hypothetical protein